MLLDEFVDTIRAQEFIVATLIAEPDLEHQLQAERRKLGLDAHDEVWEGVYFMPPIANNEHQSVQARFVAILTAVVVWPGLGDVQGGANISDRNDWKSNFRVPDVLVFLNGTKAQNRGTHWFGGPDFAIEILSPGDKARDKLPFYASVGVRELLLVDRDPWRVELYRLIDGQLIEVGRSELGQQDALESQIVPLSFCIVPGAERPMIQVKLISGAQAWLI